MGKLSSDDRNHLEWRGFAFPGERKEPLENASHVRNAIARFNQVRDVSDEERDAAGKRILSAAKKHGVDAGEKLARDWEVLLFAIPAKTAAERKPKRDSRFRGNDRPC